ncbi:MAG TPA: hypothetical protein VGY57_09230, partial [Vicinamibacterales bacterium]|nr:hypothetical protein [Vicinamibacterales bacterium]
ALAAILHGFIVPKYHDDFGYLLDADTFVRGRMSNPTHPLWPHFETMHVLQVPRYISKYPVGQGLIFAVGLKLFRNPLMATWIVTALACAAIWWALRVWTTPTLALLGGLATAVHPTMLTWIESYHGGQLAALGGALMLGAAGRLRARPSWQMSAVLGLGVVLLSISRPYEGVIFCIAIGLLLMRRSIVRVAWAGAIVVAIGLGFQAFRNYTITGNPLLLPYTVYQRQYDPVPAFIWGKARPMPQYRNAEMADVYGNWYMNQYRKVHAPGGLLKETLVKIRFIYVAVFGDFVAFRDPEPLILLLILAAIPLVIEDRNSRPIALVLLVFLFAPLSLLGWMQYHYLSTATAAAVCFVMLMLRRLFVASPLLATAVLVLFLGNAAMKWFGAETPDSGMEPKRRKIAASLLAAGGGHLVIVAPDVFEAVYNGADLDHEPIVWARDLGPAADARLVAYYRGRKVWILDRGGLKPY